ncbi:MAG: F0F1 ATP synthase subunit gamma, partial [Candidatus Omnitrophica bacterium]|nr:F0F1 ATP synthase subunit gamma [Candidatus Omnitrophota bacterium]
IEYLIYLLLGQKLYEIFGWSRLAELAARFVHLEESTQKLKELNEKLKLEYFRIRHELVDRNMRELFAARALFSHGK